MDNDGPTVGFRPCADYKMKFKAIFWLAIEGVCGILFMAFCICFPCFHQFIITVRPYGIDVFEWN